MAKPTRLTQLGHGRPLGSHPRPFRSATVIPSRRPSAKPGRNKGMSQTSAKRTKPANGPCRSWDVYTVRQADYR